MAMDTRISASVSPVVTASTNGGHVRRHVAARLTWLYTPYMAETSAMATKPDEDADEDDDGGLEVGS